MTDKEHEPLVTLALTTFNGERTIERSLAAIAAQDWPRLDILICDDASSDQTVEICTRFAAGRDDTRVVTAQRNLGGFGFGNLSRALDLARGKFFVWMCQDDAWRPDFVTKLVEAVNSTPQAVAALPACVFFFQKAGNRQERVHRMSPAYWPQNNPAWRNFMHALRRTHERHSGRKIMLSFVIHGLVDTQMFRATTAYVSSPSNLERQAAAMWTLAGRIVYVDEALYLKEAPEQFADDAAVIAERRTKHRTISAKGASLVRMVWDCLRGVWGLEHIPIRNRLAGTACLAVLFADRAPGHMRRWLTQIMGLSPRS